MVNAGRTAQAARAGVVSIDIPMDMQRKTLTAGRTASRLRVAAVERTQHLDDSAVINEAVDVVVDALAESTRPLFLLGAGLRTVERAVIRKQIADLGIPTQLSWSAIDLLDAAHPMNFGRSGLYGDRFGNMIVQNSDLVIAIGSRLAIPQMSYDPADYARNARVIVVDVDLTELDKFVGERWIPVQADAGRFLAALHAAKPSVAVDSWIGKARGLRESFPRRKQAAEAIPVAGRGDFHNSYDVVYEISDQAGPTDIFTTDMGTGLLSGFYGLDINDEQRLSTSLGLGEMGYGLPAAIGIQIANPDHRVICLNADGGMMLNLQELQTVAHHQLPIKLRRLQQRRLSDDQALPEQPLRGALRRLRQGLGCLGAQLREARRHVRFSLRKDRYRYRREGRSGRVP